MFFDVGGVLGSNGWDTEQRAAAVARFSLDADDLQRRHKEMSGTLEQGRATLDEYLDLVVFHQARAFSRDEFRAFMLAQSVPWIESLSIAREVAATEGVRLYTLNNESDELNRHRIARFGLADLFAAFFTSCWLGALKPSRRIYELALAMSQTDPARAVFIDDREQNLEPARALGMRAIRFRDAASLRADLAALGLV